MSGPTVGTSNATATIWPVSGKDKYGRSTYGTPYTVTATFAQGSTRRYRDASGTDYIPASIYWYEFDEYRGLPKFNDFIALGDHAATSNPNDVDRSELIKNRTRQDNSLLGDPDDVEVLT